MHLKRLTIDRLPGIRDRFEIKAAGPGVHIIFGPNGSGKSSICRAVEGLYWADRGSPKRTAVSGEFERDGAIWRAEREGPELRWSDGEKVRASPVSPASHNSRCFFLSLRELVDTSPNSSDDIAAEIRRQMSGGFDLDKIAKELFDAVTPRRTRGRRKEYNEALEHVQKAEISQSGIQQQVDGLGQLEERLEEAKTAAGRLALVQRAIDLAQRRDQLAEIEKQLGAMPAALTKLTGKEHEDVKSHQQQLVELKVRANELQEELDGARAKQEECRLAAPVDEVKLAKWREKAEELVRIDLEVNAARAANEAARKKLAEASSAIGIGSIKTAGLSLPDHAELFQFLRDSQEYAKEAGAILERLELLKSLDAPRAGEPELEQLRAAADALRSWLRAAPPPSVGLQFRARWLWLLFAAAMVLSGGWLAYFFDPALLLIALLGAGVGLAAIFLGSGRDLNHPRRHAQEAFEDMGLEQPTQWDVPSVRVALRDLENRTWDLGSSLKRARDRDVEMKSLENRLRGLKEHGNKLKNRRRELQSKLGLDDLTKDAELVDYARALGELRDARGECEAVTGKLQCLEQIRKDGLDELGNFLNRYTESRPASSAEAKTSLTRLANRDLQFRRAVADQQRSGRDLKQIADDQEKIRGSIRRIYSDGGLQDGDSRGLAALLAALPRYSNLKSRRTDLKSKNDLDRDELERVGESALCEQDGKFLEDLRDELRSAASQVGDLGKEIGQVESAMEGARESTTMQDLIAAQETARAKLRDLRDQTLFAKAGRILIDEVEQEYEQNQMPRVFEHARQHFSEFTFHNYELHVNKDRGHPRLFAVELSGGRRRELDELSDGTRAQLLLAARIAFAEEAEQGQTLPLFLDEALDQSDPQRFEAIAKSLGCIARDQERQIFYLTSDPLDVERFRRALAMVDCGIAAEIDLGAIRTSAASVSGPQELRVEPAPSIPAPNGKTPEEYGALLRVPTFRPSIGSSEQHMFYVLWDDLELLHRFLTNGIERSGQWNTVANTSLAERLGSRSIIAAQIGSRLDLLRIFCELWKQGRGKPVGHDALAASNAVSARYLDDVVAIAKELNGDPERLLDMLDRRGDERLKGFRERGVERLRSYLAEKEYLDDRSVLTESELQLLCVATPAANDLPGTVARECVRRWWAWSHAFSPK